MKELLNKRINSIDSLEDRKIFRDIVNHVFMDLVDYQDTQIHRLRTDIFDQMTLDEKRPVIYGTMIYKKDYDPTDNFMYPMVSKDVETQEITGKDFNQAVMDHKGYMLKRIFLKCDSETLEKIYSGEKIFTGKIHLESQNDIDIKVRLKGYTSYSDILEHLYATFIQNGFQWRTTNLPYIYKFAAVMLAEPVTIPDDEVVEYVSVDIGEYSSYCVEDIIPVWNLEYTQVQSINFPIPTLDNVLQEHRFDVYDLSPFCYIPDFGERYDGYVKRSTESVSVIIPEKDIKEWPMYKLHPQTEGKHYVYPFEIYGNSQSDNFYIGYENTRIRNVRTKGEIERIIHAFKASEMFRFNGFEIVENKPMDKASTYDINTFIPDEICSICTSNRLLEVHYTYKYDDVYICDDIMSFIISELQQYFSDIKCVGINDDQDRR